MKRSLGLLLISGGAILALVNAIYLPAALEFHDGEWPIALYHGTVIAGGFMLIALGAWLRRR